MFLCFVVRAWPAYYGDSTSGVICGLHSANTRLWLPYLRVAAVNEWLAAKPVWSFTGVLLCYHQGAGAHWYLNFSSFTRPGKCLQCLFDVVGWVAAGWKDIQPVKKLCVDNFGHDNLTGALLAWKSSNCHHGALASLAAAKLTMFWWVWWLTMVVLETGNWPLKHSVVFRRGKSVKTDGVLDNPCFHPSCLISWHWT